MSNKEQFDYYHILLNEYGSYSVKGYGMWESGCLKGQTKIVFLDMYDSIEEAQKAYPDAELSHALMEPENTFNHLPDTPDY